ncbi:hypothetical protein [Vibrio sp. Hal054]|uniref:hypothetical protein n=1 Tax=Vibrio sp. Hal054 TaxID=3035158 RepID=UPI00301C511B
MNNAGNDNIAILWIDDEHGGSSFKPSLAFMCSNDKPNDVSRVSLSSLDAGFTYITNVKPHLFKHMGLSKRHRLLNANFFGVTLSQIAIELGLDDDLNIKLPVMLKVFSTMENKLRQTYGLKIEECQYTILEKLREIICPNHHRDLATIDGANSLHLNNAIRESTQKLQANNIDIDKKFSTVVSGKFPKLPYFIHLMGQGYPVSHNYQVTTDFQDRTVGMNGSEDDSRLVVDFARKKAGFMEFQVEDMQKDHRRYIPVGMEITTTRSRRWAALPEIVDMMNYATLRLGQCFYTDSEPLPFVPAEPPIETKFMNYTNGLINEAIWVAISYSNNSDASASPIAAYVRAYDRVMCRRAATELFTQGFRLVGFSTGTVRFVVDSGNESQKEKLAQALLEQNLLPQLGAL